MPTVFVRQHVFAACVRMSVCRRCRRGRRLRRSHSRLCMLRLWMADCLAGLTDWLTGWPLALAMCPLARSVYTRTPAGKKKHNNQIQCDDNQVKFKLLSVNVVPYHSVCIHFNSIKCMMHIICLYMCIICIFFCAYNSGRWALWIQFDCFFCPEIKPLENHLIIKQSNNISNWIVYIHDDCCQNARPETCECNSKFAILNLMIQFFQSLKNWTQFYLCVFLNTTGPVYVVIRDINWNGLGIFFFCVEYSRGPAVINWICKYCVFI